jgi:Big-like domain-containing protein
MANRNLGTKTTGPRSSAGGPVVRWGLGVVTLLAALSIALGAQAPLPTAAPFDMTGFIQSATVDNPSDLFSGGTITVNGIRMIVPRNTLLQFPATALTWQEAFALAPAPYTKLQTGMALSDVPRPATTYEVHAVGNRVGGQHIVGLLFLSQQSLHAGQGFITAIDYATGEMRVGGVAGTPSLDARVRINDPIGRFGRAFSPDVRFTIDEDNPTVHTGNFYPMCLPRTNPASADDPLCPQKNRPKDSTGRFMTLFSMPPPGGPSGPDARLMAPFEVGDFITYNGIQVSDASGPYIAAHTIESNMTIITAPGTQPAYVGMNVLIMGVSTKAGAPAGTEGAVRTRVEGFSTDVTLANIVSVMAVDVDPCTGAESERTWGFAATDVLVALGRFRFRPSSKDETFLPGVRELRVRNTSGTVLAPTPNGLLAGEYTAPLFDFLFSEPAPAGGINPLPANFWDLQFLAQGSGPYTGRLGQSGMLGQLSPWPGALTPAPGCGATGGGETVIPPAIGPAPIAAPDTIGLTGTSATVSGATLLANDTGAGPVTLVAVAPFSASGGAITGSDPFTFVPAPGFTGSDSFTYEISDGSGQTAIGVVTVTATADTTPPGVSLTSPSGGLLSGNVVVAAAASDNVGVAGVRFFDGATQIGSEIVAAPFQISWNTALAVNGNHNLTAVARDVAGNIATSAVVGVNISNVAANVPPIANGDSATTNAGTAVTIAVLANDTDANGDTLTVTAASNAIGGAVTVNAATTVTYQPLAGFSGTGSFVYTVSDGHGGTANGVAAVVVLPPPNLPPVANPDSATTSAGVPVTIAVLANDTDPNGDPLTVTAVSGAAGGSAAIIGGTTVSFSPAAGFSGAASFTYSISDGHGGTASAGVTVTVAAVPTVDRTVSADGTGARTTPQFSTANPGEVLVAFAASDGPSAANAQTLTVSGAGLAWTRVRSIAGRPGVVEIWTATAPAVLTNVTVTSTQSVTAGGPFNQSLTVVAFTGVSGVGASNAVSGLSTSASAGVVTQAAGSLIYAVGNDFDRGIARTVPAGQTKVHEFLAPTGDTFWVQTATAPIATAGTTATLTATVPAPADQFNLAIVEVKR